MLIRMHKNKIPTVPIPRIVTAFLVALLSVCIENAVADTWRGLTVEPEFRCSPYSSKDYSYSQSVEPRIVNSIGKMYSPYTGRCFTNLRQTDIEHIVARSEAHDSGMCSADYGTRRSFASDLLNLTLASPQVNRNLKRHYDAADWLPELNQCWFAGRVVAVKRKYGLTVDQREADALEVILSKCETTDMIVGRCITTESFSVSPPSGTASNPAKSSDALARWDDNGNGRITCKEAKRHGIAPVHKEHPAYIFMNDRDNDGVVCE